MKKTRKEEILEYIHAFPGALGTDLTAALPHCGPLLKDLTRSGHLRREMYHKPDATFCAPTFKYFRTDKPYTPGNPLDNLRKGHEALRAKREAEKAKLNAPKTKSAVTITVRGVQMSTDEARRFYTELKEIFG